jgi:hypothetical protein
MSGNENIGCDTTIEVTILEADGEWIELLSVNLFMGSFDISKVRLQTIGVT